MVVKVFDLIMALWEKEKMLVTSIFFFVPSYEGLLKLSSEW